MKRVLTSMLSSHYRLAILAALIAVLCHGRCVSAVTLTMDELSPQPINGLSFEGVTFGFQIDGSDSLDANYHSGGPHEQMFVQDPSIEGNARGVLSLDFATSTPTLEFGVALSTEKSLNPGFTVELFDSSSTLLSTTPVDTSIRSVDFSFTEGLFAYQGEPVSRAMIHFEPSAGRFSFDNLKFVPEPAGMQLVLISTMGLMLLLPVSDARGGIRSANATPCSM